MTSDGWFAVRDGWLVQNGRERQREPESEKEERERERERESCHEREV